VACLRQSQSRSILIFHRTACHTSCLTASNFPLVAQFDIWLNSLGRPPGSAFKASCASSIPLEHSRVIKSPLQPFQEKTFSTHLVH